MNQKYSQWHHDGLDTHRQGNLVLPKAKSQHGFANTVHNNAPLCMMSCLLIGLQKSPYMDGKELYHLGLRVEVISEVELEIPGT